jgi:hypothetical protein
VTTAEGARDCGCAWQHLADGSVRYTRRCDRHRTMCRPIEPWEIQLTRPGDRAGRTRPAEEA